MVAPTKTFRHFVETEYKLSYWASQQHDRARRRPVVKPPAIFRAGVGQGVFGLGSVLQVDQWLRTNAAQHFIGQPADARCRGSDSTLLRALGAWDLGPARAATYALHLWQRDLGRANRTLSSGRSVRLAVVDGSCFGGVWASVLGFAGTFYYSVDVERYAGRGHELAASRAVLARATQRLGAGFATHLLYDGLMCCVRQAQQFGLVVRPSFPSPRGGKISSVRRPSPISSFVVHAAGPCRGTARLPAILRVVRPPAPAPTVDNSPRSGRCGSHACAVSVLR